MAKISIANKLKNEPMFLDFGDKEYKVNNGKNTVLLIMEMWEDTTINDIKKIDKTIELALGKTAYDEIEAMELSMENYKTVAMAIMAILTGESLESFEARFQAATA